MAEFKRQTFQFTTGKQIKLYGNSFFVNKSLEIGEGFAPNIFFLFEEQTGGRPSSLVYNLHKLTAEELHELADYNIRLWMDFKEGIRKNGITSPKLFNRENPKGAENNSERPVRSEKPDKQDKADKTEKPVE